MNTLTREQGDRILALLEKVADILQTLVTLEVGRLNTNPLFPIWQVNTPVVDNRCSVCHMDKSQLPMGFICGNFSCPYMTRALLTEVSTTVAPGGANTVSHNGFETKTIGNL